MNERNEILGKKALFYKEKSYAVHVKLENGQFYNGFVLEISSDFMTINDFKLGDTLVFFIEVVDIEQYKREGDDETKNP